MLFPSPTTRLGPIPFRLKSAKGCYGGEGFEPPGGPVNIRMGGIPGSNHREVSHSPRALRRSHLPHTRPPDINKLPSPQGDKNQLVSGSRSPLASRLYAGSRIKSGMTANERPA